jgi:cell division protein FtsA
MRQSGVVPVGGNHVTRDIVYGMGVELDTAERWKRQFGIALRSAIVAQPVGSVALDESQRKTLAAICEARQLEILELVANGLQWGISRPALASGIILTGGGARLGGTAELAEQVFALRATTLRAPGDDYAEEPDSWATALGLAEHALDHSGDFESTISGARDRRLWSNMKRWIGRLV